MAYGTVNADVIGTSVAGSNLGAGNASIMKNRIINGAMVVNQRAGGTVSVTNANPYTLDRWQGQANISSSKFTIQQSSTAPAGFNNSLLITSSSAYSVGAGEYFGFSQAIEGYNVADLGFGTANAKTVTISFWVQSSLTGTFGAVLANGSNNRSYPFTYTISSANTWTQISVTIAGDTTGTWAKDNTNGMYLWFSVGAGSTYSGTAGSWSGSTYLSATGATSVVGTNGATFYITGVQLEVGSSATGFEYRQYGQELALCQRYFELITIDGNITFTVGTNQFGSAGAIGNQFYKVTKRASPTLSTTSSNNWYKYNVYNGSNGTCTPSFNNGNATLFSINFGGTLASSSVHWVYNQGYDYVVSSSAEL